ncbi:MAG: membrane dipeptidase [Clostridia bacterium]|nr:membrane dipeptidase [Clostridia bacterium]
MIIDLHCDTFIRMYCDGKKAEEFGKNEYHIDLEKLKKGHVAAQCFAIYNEKGDGYDTDKMYEKIGYMFDGLKLFEEDLFFYSGAHSLTAKMNEGKICAIPTIEDLGPILNDISNIDKLNNLGFKILSLTWNHENSIGYPNSSDASIMNKGLKGFGMDVVERMNELNMIIDVSHLSDGGFYDVSKQSKKPFVATHSNARSIKNSTRNLTDDMIKTLSDAGGVTGINFYHDFLCDGGTLSRIDDMVRHIRHIKNVGGIDCIAIGSDFDGIGGELEIKDASEHYKLVDALESQGFTANEIDKITHENVLRVLRDSE